MRECRHGNYAGDLGGCSGYFVSHPKRIACLTVASGIIGGRVTRRLRRAGNGVHVSFLANSIKEVKAFHAKAIELGGTDEGAPGYRGEYTPGYHAAFVRDLDGNKFEALLLDQQRTA